VSRRFELAEELQHDGGGKAEQQKLIDMLLAEMTEAVKRDRAEALYVACIPTSAMLMKYKVNKVEGAPVVDMFVSGLKIAENMVTLKRVYGSAVCKNGLYKASPPAGTRKSPSMLIKSLKCCSPKLRSMC